MNRLTVISADGHCAAREADYRDYLDEEFRADFDAALGNAAERRTEGLVRKRGGNIWGADGALNPLEQERHDFVKEHLGVDDGVQGGSDPHRRVRELEADGIVGELLFPDKGVPFTEPTVTPAQRRAGTRAHNRWMAEFCSTYPDRFAGIGIVLTDDIDEAIKDIHTTKDLGLRGGILLDSFLGMRMDEPYNHPRYEPIWQTCADLELPINCHSGGGTPTYEALPGARAIYMTESQWFAHRPFWFMLWSGVFERHPTLKVLFAEQGATWIPDVLSTLDRIHGAPPFGWLREELPLRPSDYWARQCYVNGGSGDGWNVLDQIGIDNVMWGADYPHFEGTWPHAKARFEQTASALTDERLDDMKKIVGATAGNVYGFDFAALSAVAERVGPAVN